MTLTSLVKRTTGFAFHIPQVSWQSVRGIQRRARRVSVREYREPDYPLKKLLTACEPYILPEFRPKYETCESVGFDPKLLIDEHPYNRLLAQDLKRELEACQMIVVFHLNPIEQERRRYAKCAWEHSGMYLRRYNAQTREMGMRHTRFSTLLDIMTERSQLLFMNNLNLKEMISINRKYPEFVMLAGAVDDQLLSRDRILKLRDMPSIDVMRAQLTHTLSLASQTLSQNISYQTSLLSRNLNALVDQQKKSQDSDSNKSVEDKNATTNENPQ